MSFEWQFVNTPFMKWRPCPYIFVKFCPFFVWVSSTWWTWSSVPDQWTWRDTLLTDSWSHAESSVPLSEAVACSLWHNLPQFAYFKVGQDPENTCQTLSKDRLWQNFSKHFPFTFLFVLPLHDVVYFVKCLHFTFPFICASLRFFLLAHILKLALSLYPGYNTNHFVNLKTKQEKAMIWTELIGLSVLSFCQPSTLDLKIFFYFMLLFDVRKVWVKRTNLRLLDFHMLIFTMKIYFMVFPKMVR